MKNRLCDRTEELKLKLFDSSVYVSGCILSFLKKKYNQTTQATLFHTCH